MIRKWSKMVKYDRKFVENLSEIVWNVVKNDQKKSRTGQKLVKKLSAVVKNRLKLIENSQKLFKK
jgi:hypothetical protein